MSVAVVSKNIVVLLNVSDSQAADHQDPERYKTVPCVNGWYNDSCLFMASSVSLHTIDELRKRNGKSFFQSFTSSSTFYTPLVLCHRHTLLWSNIAIPNIKNELLEQARNSEVKTELFYTDDNETLDYLDAFLSAKYCTVNEIILFGGTIRCLCVHCNIYISLLSICLLWIQLAQCILICLSNNTAWRIPFATCYCAPINIV